MDEIDSHGFWIGKNIVKQHCFDLALARTLVSFFKFEHATSVVDFGCGLGDYLLTFLNHQILAEGYDGNPITPELTKGLAKVQDFSIPFDLGRQFDWVLSLEVGEHIPAEFEMIFIENLIRHCSKGIILSWAIKNQGGFGHVNEQNNDYIKQIFANFGFINDLLTEELLRACSTLPWFKNTIMVFRKI